MYNGGAINNFTEDIDSGTSSYKSNIPLHIRLSAAQNGRAYPMIAYEWNTLVENCMFYKCNDPSNPNDVDLNIRPAVQTFYEESVVEADMHVEPDRQSDVPDTLPLTAMKLVYLWCREMGHGLHDQPRLQIKTPEAWCLNCCQIHYHIPLAGFELGHLINFGLFMQHYSLDMTDPTPSPADMLTKGEMKLSLEHDFKKMNIMFTIGEYNVTRHDRIWHLYRMTIEYASIQSAVVDFSNVVLFPGDERKGQHKLSYIALYLVIKYSPKVFVDEPKRNTNQRGSNEINKYGKRSHTFYRTANVLNWGKKLGRSTVIKLIYPVDGDTPNRMHCATEFWNILSRLKTRARIQVYFMSIRSYEPEFSEIDSSSISDELFASFGSFYLVKALMSRGYAVLDQIDPKFITLIADASVVNRKATEKALAQLLAAVDEHRYVALMIAFEKLYKSYAMSTSDISLHALTISGSEDEIYIPKNCVRVRKLIVTPTRLLMMPPEVMMSNRVLRKFGEEYALRVLFRDEDGSKLHADRMQEDLFKEMVSKLLIEGIKIGKRHYRFLAWSNSQLRDHGCYMYATNDENKTVADIRSWMGDFTASANVPKMMSRMGQCFTQAQEAVIIPFTENSSLVRIEHDVESVAKDPNGDPYLFSDGIGCLSMALAREVCQQLELTQPVPSAYQIRYAGCKGMLSVDVRLDKNPQGHQLVLRESMKKFSSDQSWALEIVKYSQPSPVYLNRPLIMILDQVSRKQNCGPRMHNEIHKLLEQELFHMADMLLSEDVSVEALVNKTPLKIDYKRLRLSGFNLTAEPFFRGLLLAVHKYTIKAQLFKAKVEIPLNQGRTMYGVLDELNVLQYGQVFVQYSENLKKPGENVKVLRGKVMVTKNPCLVPGDVRILDAVYKESLKHLVDVIVFPRNGPRPHTDEMAGSDLDGDEYAVYWNQNLMFNGNEKAMHFPKVKPPQIQGGVKDSDMVDFFIKYVRQDSIGTVATAHLVMSDQKGIFHPICMNIARKCSTAVDFPKTGEPAASLTEEEYPLRYPDFMQRERRPMYRSPRLLGQLFRKIKMVSDTVEVGQVEVLNRFTFDADLQVPGYQDYFEQATEAHDRFTHHLQALLDQYGIQDESQLVSGYMVTVRNRVSDGEKEDFSFYNTERIVELRIHRIFEKFRREFFDEFGGEREELLESPSTTAQQKASAYYMVTYLQDQTTHTNRPMLSFPWLVWEVLACIKRHKVFQRGVDREFVEPVHSRLSKTIKLFNERPDIDTDRVRLLKTVLTAAPELHHVLKAYGPDFAYILYVILHWFEKEQAFGSRRNLQLHHVALLLVHYASGQTGFTDKVGDSVQYILPLPEIKCRLAECQTASSAGNILVMYRVGSLCLNFIKYLASQFFRTQSRLDFNDYGIESVFETREWYFVNSIAFKTYHHIAWTSNFISLHLSDPNEPNTNTLKWDRDELDPMPVQLNNDYILTSGNGPLRILVECSRKLKEWSNMEEVQMRLDCNCRDSDQYLVVGVGSLEARNRLKEILLDDDLEYSLFNKDGKCPSRVASDE